jgi:hypothetical protein
VDCMIQRISLAVFTIAASSLSGVASGKSLQMKDLPPAVQKTIQDNLKGGEIRNISKEKEKGVIEYEIETIVGSKHRDFNVDAKGSLVVVEEEVDIATIPAAARAAIEKKAAGGKVGMVETMTKGNLTLFEAAFTTKSGKKGHVLVNADGVETRE